MTTVDYALIAIVLISMLFGAIRGFLRESVALLGWLVGLWLAWRYAPAVQPYLGGSLTDTDLQVWVARLILLLAATLLFIATNVTLGYTISTIARSQMPLMLRNSCPDGRGRATR